MQYRIAALLVALLLLLGLVGHFDYQDQEAEEAQYCDMVKAKLWNSQRASVLFAPFAE
jgi:hypothetical protein